MEINTAPIMTNASRIITREKSTHKIIRWKSLAEACRAFDVSPREIKMLAFGQITHPTHEFSFGYGSDEYVIGEQIVSISDPDAAQVLLVSNLGKFYIFDSNYPVDSRPAKMKKQQTILKFRGFYYNLAHEVAQAFHPGYNQKYHKIWFLDGNTKNCCIDNLCPVLIGTGLGLMRHSRTPDFYDIPDLNLQTTPAKITKKDKEKIKYLRSTGLYTVRDLADIWATSPRTIKKILIKDPK
jgi:hypothetical protein